MNSPVVSFVCKRSLVCPAPIEEFKKSKLLKFT